MCLFRRRCINERPSLSPLPPPRQIGSFYSVFRNVPYIDGGYCSDFKQFCPPTFQKNECLKVSTTFLGPDLRGTPPATPATCPAVTAPNTVPNLGKPYYTPADASLWTLPQGSCAVPAQAAAVGATPGAVPLLAQGVSAKPDIHPFFYAPLPTAIASACDWLALSSNPTPTPAEVQAQYQHGIDSALGWADAHGYCA